MNSRISSLQNADDILILEWIKVEEKIAEKRKLNEGRNFGRVFFHCYHGLNIAKFKGHLGIHNMMGWQKAISDSTHDC